MVCKKSQTFLCENMHLNVILNTFCFENVFFCVVVLCCLFVLLLFFVLFLLLLLLFKSNVYS